MLLLKCSNSSTTDELGSWCLKVKWSHEIIISGKEVSMTTL